MGFANISSFPGLMRALPETCDPLHSATSKRKCQNQAYLKANLINVICLYISEKKP
jgi:hypothetical protein